jgi:hypothetical protein
MELALGRDVAVRLLDCEAVCNLQADAPAAELELAQFLQVTNYHYRGLGGTPHVMTDEQQAWVQQHFATARRLLDNDVFQSATHALASYRWHSVPRARMALLWAGIEGLFKVESEIVFRLSLYVARFLFPDDADLRRQTFERTKRLYKTRSAAVHGGEIKGDTKALVADSASLLREVLSRCLSVGSLPDTSTLAP